jgi:hypothetical protein
VLVVQLVIFQVSMLLEVLLAIFQVSMLLEVLLVTFRVSMLLKALLAIYQVSMHLEVLLVTLLMEPETPQVALQDLFPRARLLAFYFLITISQPCVNRQHIANNENTTPSGPLQTHLLRDNPYAKYASYKSCRDA